MLIRRSALVIILGLALAACGSTSTTSTAPSVPSAASTTAASAPVRVVTTMSILADVIKQVGGERVVVENIIPVGAGPEDYQPTPQDAQKIAQAQVVFFNGHGLEAWLDPLFTNAGTAALVRVELSKDIAGIDADEEFTQGNPHFWLNPQYVTTYTTIVRDTLSQLDPAGAAVYQANALRYGATLTALDTELQTQAATIPEADRKMVTNHDAFPYFAQRYGLTIVGNILNSDEAELSAGDLAALVEKLRSAQVKAIFAESQFNQNVSQTLARETGINVIATLYTDSLGTSEAATYVDMMRYNMRTIVHALTGTR